MWQNRDPVSHMRSEDITFTSNMWFYTFMVINSKPKCKTQNIGEETIRTKTRDKVVFAKRRGQEFQDTKVKFLMAKKLNTSPSEEDFIGRKCTAIIPGNFGEPEWVLVDCNEKLATVVYCRPKKTEFVTNFTSLSNLACCAPGWSTRILSICFCFVWRPRRKLCPDFRFDVLRVKSLFDSVSQPLPPIFKNWITIFTYTRCLSVTKYFHSGLGDIKVHAFVVRSKLPEEVKIAHNTLKCNSTFISILHLCDGKSDCAAERPADESSCTCTSENYSATCKFVGNSSTNICSDFFYFSRQGDCQILLFPQLNDLRNTFWPQVTNNVYGRCRAQGMIPCTPSEESPCYYIKDICIYRFDENHNAVPCIFGEHMQNCRQFTCNGMYKCPHFYCIPWKYVCDGTFHCPQGYDELQKCHTDDTRCTNLYKCSLSQVCIHALDICDGETDCPAGDDELMCSRKLTECPSTCHCLLVTVRCFNSSVSAHNMYFTGFQAVFIYHSSTAQMQLFTSDFDPVILVITDSGITSVCKITQQTSRTVFVDTSCNLISEISTACFGGGNTTRSIKLQENTICLIENKAFANLHNLMLLNVSENRILLLDDKLFCHLNLGILSVQGNSFLIMGPKLFQEVTLGILETDDFYKCCTISAETKCTVGLPNYVSCFHILPEHPMIIVSWIFSILTEGLCTVSISLQSYFCVSKSKGKKTGSASPSFVIIAVSIADFFCGGSSLANLVSDVTFGGAFYHSAHTWQSGSACFVILFFTSCYSLVLPLLLTFVCLVRLMIVVHPITTKFNKLDTTCTWLLCLFTVSLLLSGFFTFGLWIENGSVPTSWCSPFLDPMGSFSLIKLFTFVVGFIQIMASVAMLILYPKLLVSLRRSEASLRSTKNKQHSKSLLIFQIFCVPVLNMLCWTSSSAIFLTFHFQKYHSAHIAFWAAVAIFPFNSLLNPVVFVIITIRTRLKS